MADYRVMIDRNDGVAALHAITESQLDIFHAARPEIKTPFTDKKFWIAHFVCANLSSLGVRSFRILKEE